VLVEGEVTNIVSDGTSNALLINGNGCDGIPAGTGVDSTCSSSTATVMVTSTQACTSSAQNSLCTNVFSTFDDVSDKTCQCDTSTMAPTAASTSAAARMDRVLVAIVSSVTGLMAFLLF
jgi:hypothetical protein